MKPLTDEELAEVRTLCEYLGPQFVAPATRRLMKLLPALLDEVERLRAENAQACNVAVASIHRVGDEAVAVIRREKTRAEAAETALASAQARIGELEAPSSSLSLPQLAEWARMHDDQHRRLADAETERDAALESARAATTERDALRKALHTAAVLVSNAEHAFGCVTRPGRDKRGPCDCIIGEVAAALAAGGAG